MLCLFIIHHLNIYQVSSVYSTLEHATVDMVPNIGSISP